MEHDDHTKAQELIAQTNAKGIIRATITVDFIIPYYETRPLQVLAKEWFEKFHIGQAHAYRDNCKIGFSERVIDHEIITKD